MSQRKKLLIVTAALVGLGALALIWAWVTYGGTPIIIKGFDDGDGDPSTLNVTIEGSPSKDNATQTAGKHHHTRTGDPITRIYVLADGKCVIYGIKANSDPRLSIDIGGAKDEIVLEDSSALKRYDLLFDESTTYAQDSTGKYKRRQPSSIEAVKITAAASCTAEDGSGLTCPTDFSNFKKVTIGVNYRKACEQ